MIDIDEVGVLYELDQGTGAPLMPLIPLQGWHVNTTHLMPSWADVQVTPAAPQRLFSGVPTFHYRFENRAAYRAALLGQDLTLPPPQLTPQRVTRFQARAALHLAGLLPEVEELMADPDTDMLARLAWQDAQEFNRASPTVSAMSQALGLDAAAVDALFVAASSIEA